MKSEVEDISNEKLKIIPLLPYGSRGDCKVYENMERVIL